MEDSNLELFFDTLEKSISVLYEKTHNNYFDLYFETVKNILDCELSKEYDAQTNEHLLRIYSKLTDVDFTPEDIRKALQAIIIRGFKESKIEQDVTPDTLGFLMAYLISRLNNGLNDIKILDPLCGSGNLLFSIDNHLNLNCSLFAIDNNKLKVDLCKTMSDLMNTVVDLYFQDTRSIRMKDMDFVIFDTPNELDEEKYFPYEVVLNHINSLKKDGYMIGIVPNDFFEHDKDGLFKQELMKDSSIYGIIELPDNFFISRPKSIVIIKHKIRDDKNCLMVKLPSFDDIKLFNETLMQIEAWFENNKN